MTDEPGLDVLRDAFILSERPAGPDTTRFSMYCRACRHLVADTTAKRGADQLERYAILCAVGPRLGRS
jgi:hypothetical protein